MQIKLKLQLALFLINWLSNLIILIDYPALIYTIAIPGNRTIRQRTKSRPVNSRFGQQMHYRWYVAEQLAEMFAQNLTENWDRISALNAIRKKIPSANRLTASLFVRETSGKLVPSTDCISLWRDINNRNVQPRDFSRVPAFGTSVHSNHRFRCPNQHNKITSATGLADFCANLQFYFLTKKPGLNLGICHYVLQN